LAVPAGREGEQDIPRPPVSGDLPGKYLAVAVVVADGGERRRVPVEGHGRERSPVAEESPGELGRDVLASAAEPPFPQVRSRPPAAIDRAIIATTRSASPARGRRAIAARRCSSQIVSIAWRWLTGASMSLPPARRR